MINNSDIKIFAGSSGSTFVNRMCDYIAVEPGNLTCVENFNNGENGEKVLNRNYLHPLFN